MPHEFGGGLGDMVIGHGGAQERRKIVVVGWHRHPKSYRPRIDPAHVHVPKISDGVRAQNGVERGDIRDPWCRRSNKRARQAVKRGRVIVDGIETFIGRSSKESKSFDGIAVRVSKDVDPKGSKGVRAVQCRQLLPLDACAEFSRGIPIGLDGALNCGRRLGDRNLIGSDLGARGYRPFGWVRRGGPFGAGE
jgi:hypothetical protein